MLIYKNKTRSSEVFVVTEETKHGTTVWLDPEDGSKERIEVFVIMPGKQVMTKDQFCGWKRERAIHNRIRNPWSNIRTADKRRIRDRRKFPNMLPQVAT